MDNIKVGIRVRPLLPREKASGSQWVCSGNSVSQKGSSSASPYYFDHVFEGDIPTVKVYETLAKPIVLSVMEGFNGTIFAYGQTSSGKTHTMMGDEENYGIIPHSIAELFDFIEKSPEREFLIRASYLEIYNETLTDLLDPSNKHLKIRENSERNVSVHGLMEHPVVDVQDVGMIITQGEEYRSVGETMMNDRSSRSHTIFTLTVESRLRGEEVEDKAVKVATLNLVDLAGSERPSATGAEGIRFTEGTFINKSLLVLGNVISKLSEGNSSHIPFRDSKLTRILQTSLGGNAKTCIICTVTPAEMLETHSTLKFASRAKNIKNKPVVNEIVVGEEALKKKLKKFERENEQLKKKLEEGLSSQERQQLTELIDQKEKERCDIEARMKALEDIIVKSSSSSSGNGQTKEKNVVHHISRRRTICPSYLSRDTPKFSPLPLTASKPPQAPLLITDPSNSPPHFKSTPVSNRRVTFAPSPSFVSPFIVKFDSESFDKHLKNVKTSEQEDGENPKVSSFVVDRRRRMKSRLSFLPPISTSTPGSICSSTSGASSFWEDSLETSVISAGRSITTCDVHVQTSPLKSSLSSVITSESNTQTDPPQATPTPIRPLPPRSGVPSSPALDVLHRSCSKSAPLNTSLCVHRTESKRAVERMEDMQFVVDENAVRMEELEHLLLESQTAQSASEASSQESQEELQKMKVKVKDMEMASEAQEELLLSLQSRLKQANTKIHQLEELNQGLQKQLTEMEAPPTVTPPPPTCSTPSEDEVRALEHEVETLKSQLADSNSEHAVKLNQAIAEHNEKEDTLTSQLHNVTSQLQIMTTTRDELSTVNESLSQKVATIEQQAAELTARLEESETQMKAMEVIRIELDDANTRLEAMESLQIELKATKELLQSAQTTCEEFKMAKESTETLHTELATQVADNEALRTELQQTKEQLRSVDDLCTQLEDAKTQLQGMGSLRIELQETKEQLSELEKLRAELQHSNGKAEILHAELANAKEELAVAQNLPTELQQANDQLSDMDKLRGELQQAKEELQAMEGLCHNETHIVELTTEVAELRSQLKVMDDLQLELAEAKREIEFNSHDDSVPVSLSSELSEARATQLSGELQESLQTIDALRVELADVKKEAELTKEELERVVEKAACEVNNAREEVVVLKERLVEVTESGRGDVRERDHMIQQQSEEIDDLKEKMKQEAIKMEKDRDEFTRESHQLAQEVTDLKTQLLSWQRKIEDTHPVNTDTTKNDENSQQQIELLTTKLVEMETLHQEEAEDFQRMYKSKVDEASQASERVCQLEEELEQLRETESHTQSTQSDRCNELEEMIAERDNTILKLNDKVARVQDEAHRMWTDHEEKLSTAESAVKDLQHQLAVVSEQLSSEAVVCEELKSSLAEARKKLEDGEREIEKAVQEKNEAMWNEDQLDTKCCLLENDVEDLNEELKHKKSLLEQMEGVMATLKQDMQDKMNVLQEKMVSSNALVDELRQKLEDGEREIEKAVQEKNEAMWNEDQLDTKCCLLENDVEDLNEELKHKKSLLEQMEGVMATLKQDMQDKMNVLQEKMVRSNALVDELREKLEDGEREIEKAVQEKNEAMWNEDQLDTKCCLLESDVEDLNEELKLKKSQIESLESEIETMQQYIKDRLVNTQRDNDTDSTTTIKELQQQIVLMTEQLSSEAGVCEELKSSLAEAREKLEDGEREIEKAVQEKNEAMWNEDQLETKCCLLENDVEDLNEELKSTKAVVAELEATIETLKQASQEREVAVNSHGDVDDLETLNDEERKLLFAKLQQDLDYMTRKCSVLDELLTEKENLLATSNDKLTETQNEFTKSMSEMNTKLEALKEENEKLRLRVQGLSCIPAPPTEPVVDGSGAITGLAYYQMEQELRVTRRECNELKDKYQKLKTEFKERMVQGNDIEDLKRYREQRNIFMTKYEHMKKVCTCGAKDKIRRDALATQDSSSISIHKSDTSSHDATKPLPPPPITVDNPPHPHKVMPCPSQIVATPTTTVPQVPSTSSVKLPTSSKPHTSTTSSTLGTVSSASQEKTTNSSSSKIKMASAFSQFGSCSSKQPPSYAATSAAQQRSAPNEKKSLFSYKFPAAAPRSSSLWSTTTSSSAPLKKETSETVSFIPDKPQHHLPSNTTVPVGAPPPVSLAEKKSLFSYKFPPTTNHPSSATTSNDVTLKSSKFQHPITNTTTTTQRGSTSSSLWSTVGAGDPHLKPTKEQRPSQPSSLFLDKPTTVVPGVTTTGENTNPATTAHAFLEDCLRDPDERSEVMEGKKNKRKLFWEDSILDSTQAFEGDKRGDPLTNNDCKTQ